jgi:hypothetical protein
MTEVVTIAGASNTRFISLQEVETLGNASKSCTITLENADESLSDSYEAYDTIVIETEGVTVFNGRISSIDIQESDGIIEIEGSDYIGDLQGEYIIEAYGISQDIGSDISAGSLVVISITDTTGFEEGDSVTVTDDNNSENATITAVVANTSITVDELSNSYTTADSGYVTVGELSSDIVADLVQKYGASMTRTGIVTTTNKYIKLFKGVTAYDAIQDLADADNFIFGHDNSLDFYYRERTYIDSGLTLDLDTDAIVDYNFPASGYDIVNRVDIYGATVNGVQVAARIEDPASQEYYGIIKSQMVIDDTIPTLVAAEAYGDNILADKAWVVAEGSVTAIGYESLEVGQLIPLSNFESIDDGDFVVTEITRDMDAGTIEISLAQYAKTLEDYILELIKNMRYNDASAIDADAVQSKFMNFYETETHTDAIVEIVALNINDGYIAGHETNSICGRGYTGVGGTALKCGRYITEEVIL